MVQVPFQKVSWHGRVEEAYSFRTVEPCNVFCVPPLHAFILYLRKEDASFDAHRACLALRVTFEKMEPASEAKRVENNPNVFCSSCLAKGCEHQKNHQFPYLIYAWMNNAEKL